MYVTAACKCLHGLGICVWFYPNKLMMMMMMMMMMLIGEHWASLFVYSAHSSFL